MFWTLLLIVICVSIGVLVVVELYARFVLGLCDRPLWRFDEDYEYILQPNQRARSLGRNVLVNTWGMRSRDAVQNKTDPNEFRVLVLGDSIVNGLPRIDQSELATTKLEERLERTLQRAVWVGNISAGSWGPPNLLAYIDKHGLFDADVVIIVVNSADYFKQLQFRPLDLGRPERRPQLAIFEVLNNYIRRRIRKKMRATKRVATQAARTGDESTAAMRTLIPQIRTAGSNICVVQHLGKDEITNTPQAGYMELRDITRDLGVEPVNLGPAFSAAINRGESPYQDGLHPNPLGQQILANVIFEHVIRCVKK